MAENTKFAWNCMDVRGRAACHMRGVPFSTFGVPFDTFRVPNGTWPRHDIHTMVGQLCMIFQCVFRIFTFFEKCLLCL